MIMRCLLSMLLVASATLNTAAAEPATKAHLRADGTLLVDGEPVFPIGIASATLRGENCQFLADVGFNMVMNGGDTEDAFFEAAQEAGLLALAPHYNWATFATPDGRFDLAASEDKGFALAYTHEDQIGRKIEENLASWDQLPGVIGWYTAEEPKAAYSQALEFMYELIKSRSPSHLVVNISAEPAWYHHFARTCDVLMVDVFPYRPGERAQPEIKTYESVRIAKKTLPGKAIWMMGQGGKMWKNWKDFPQLELSQIRNQAYLAVIGGANGYFIYAAPAVGHFGDLDEEQTAAQWDKFRTVIGELKTLSPILCDGRDADSEVRLAWKFPNGQGMPPLTRVLDYYGDKYVLVSNLGDTAVRIQVVGPNYGLPAAYDALVLTNPDNLSVEGDVASRTASTVNEAKIGEFPELIVAPRSSGAFKLTRRPAPSP
jgi:hypothetical protein